MNRINRGGGSTDVVRKLTTSYDTAERQNWNRSGRPSRCRWQAKRAVMKRTKAPKKRHSPALKSHSAHVAISGNGGPSPWLHRSALKAG